MHGSSTLSVLVLHMCPEFYAKQCHIKFESSVHSGDVQIDEVHMQRHIGEQLSPVLDVCIQQSHICALLRLSQSLQGQIGDCQLLPGPGRPL